MDIDNYDNWNIVSKKKERIIKKDINLEYFIDQKIIINTLYNYFSNINEINDLVAVYIYGSVASNTHNENSDIDILTFWKKIPFDIIPIYKLELYKLLGKSVDDLNYYKYKSNNKYRKNDKNNFRISEEYIDSIQANHILVYIKNNKYGSPINDIIII